MTSKYVLGHSDAELQRLMWQAEVLRPYTERLLRLAEIGPGMRVLDVGCGAGDVTMLAAELVGPSGSVIGIDRSERPLALAASRAESAGLPWVEFRHASMEEFRATVPFDAVIGRHVVSHQADPAAFLRAAGRVTASGGVLAVHDTNVLRPTGIRPDVPLWRQAEGWVRQAATAVSPHTDAGARLIEHFHAAGLPEPMLYCEVPVGGGEDSPVYRWIAESLRSMLPVLSRLGVSVEDIGIDTLEARLRTAVRQARAQIEWYPQFLALSRQP